VKKKIFECLTSLSVELVVTIQNRHRLDALEDLALSGWVIGFHKLLRQELCTQL